MALAGTVTGDGILVSKTKGWEYPTTQVTKSNDEVWQATYKVEIEEEVREWVALTQTAAVTAVEGNENTSKIYVAEETCREAGAYKLTVTTTTKTSTLYSYVKISS